MKLIKDGVLQVKVNDIIEHRNGEREIVRTNILRGLQYNFPVIINNNDYTSEGKYALFGEHLLDIVAIIPHEIVNADVNPKAAIQCDFTKPSRMIDLFAQGAEFVADENGDVWRLQNGYPQYFHTKWNPDAVSFCLLLCKPATIAENPEKPKKVVYNWVYKVCDQDFYCTTSGKYENEEQVHDAIEGQIVFIEKIEHSREAV